MLVFFPSAMPTTEYPKNIMGRSNAIVWFLTGIVLSSLFISSLTSSMSVWILDHRLDIVRGKKVNIINYARTTTAFKMILISFVICRK